MSKNRQAAAALAAALSIGAAAGALAQTSVADPHHPDAAAPGSDVGALQDAAPELGQPGPSAQPQTGAPSATVPGMMGQGMMGTGMMSGMMPPSQMRPMAMMHMSGMRPPMLKIFFAATDADGDGALTAEEISAMHGRIFVVVDADRSGTVTLDEMQRFLRD